MMARPDYPDLYVLRHGETEWNRAGRWQGRLDSPLTDRGVDQARAQGRLLAEIGLDPATVAVRTSPQGRAIRTAAIVLSEAGWPGVAIADDRLREIDVGKWTGLTRAEMRAAVDLPEGASLFLPYSLAPAGEGFAALEARVRAFLSDLSGPTVVVTHGITSRFLRAAALGLTTEEAEGLPGGQGVIHRVAAGAHATLEPDWASD